MARIRDSSVRDVVAAADMVEVVSARTQLRRASGSRFTGRCPFHEEKTPSFSVNPVDKLYYCFGCGKGGDVISFVRETREPRLRRRRSSGSPSASASRSSTRRRRPRIEAIAGGASACSRCSTRRRRTSSACSGTATPARPCASTSPGAGSARRSRRSSGSGSRRARGLAEKAKERGFTLDELKSAGPRRRRVARDYFPQRLMFPLADARGRVVGFQARKLREDDPLRGKYVNSPEGDLFHKSAILYGLHLAKAAIAKQDFAAVVEGNTDVIALRQAGFEPVVASMGTALTERQLRELGRLTKKLYLCFDADAAGQEATLRGMELAAAQGFDVKVVTLPEGQDPADAPDGFEERLRRPRATSSTASGSSSSARPTGRRASFARARCSRRPRTRRSGRRRCGCSRTGSTCRGRRSPGSRPRAGGGAAAVGRGAAAARCGRPAGARRARRVRRPSRRSCRGLAELTSDHFDSELNRRFRDALVTGRDDPELTALRAELDARAAQEAIDERTGTELLLRLRERKLKRDLAGADLARTTELQAHLAKVRQALAELTRSRARGGACRPRPRRRRAARRSGPSR